MSDPWDDLPRINPGFGMPRYSRIEINDLLVAMLGLSVAFTILFYRDDFFSSNFAMNMVLWFALAVALVSTSFIFHELAHKVVAQKYGAWAEFRVNPMGVLMAMIVALFGFLFAAPGAVYIRGMIDRRMNGHISAAGPLVNLIIGGSALAVALLTSGMISTIMMLFATLNAFLAIFNLLPIPPLDGSKIYPWNMPVYVIMMGSAVLLLLTAMGWII
jgi:Zn-dependent proteases